MAKRAFLTIIFLGAHRTDRVDLGPGPGFPVIEQFHKPAQGSEDPAERVEASLVSTPRIGKMVWVLWEGVSAQVLDMPSGVVQGLEGEQLSGALGFEVEPLTGVPSNESAIDGFQMKNSAGVQPEFRRFWIAQLTTEVRNQVESVVTRAGAKFAGITHPGGLPRDRWSTTLDPETPHEWRRIEIWDNVTFSLHGTPDGNVDTRIIRSQPGSEGWIAELPKSEGHISWMSAGPATRTTPDGQRIPDPQRMALWDALMTPGSGAAGTDPIKIDFPEAAPPVDWLRAWAAELTMQKRVPTVEPPSRVSPYRKYFLVGGAAAGLVLSASLGHWGYFTWQTNRLHKQADDLGAMRAALAPKNEHAAEEAEVKAELEKLQAHQKELQDRETALKADLAKAEESAARIEAAQNRLWTLRSIHKPALRELLAALVDLEAHENPGKIIVKDIRQDDSGTLQITGLCGESSAADVFATRLASRLENAGWKVNAARKILREDRLAFDFSVMLMPQVLLNLPPGLLNGKDGDKKTARLGADPSKDTRLEAAAKIPAGGTR